MGTDNTSTSFPSPEVLEAQKRIQIFSLVLYCVIIVLGTVGNGLVIYVTGFKMKKTVNSVWFLNLAIADFLFTAFLIFTTTSLHHNNQWPFGNFMCKFNSFVAVVNMFASIFLLTAISLDRFLSIWVVVWAQNKRTVCKAQITCAVIWLAAGICSSPFAYFRGVLEHGGKEFCGYPSIKPEQSRSLNIFRFVMGFLLPFLVILSSYVAISLRARRMQRSRRRRSHRIIISIILAFFICWLPFHVMNFIELKSRNNPDLIGIVLHWGPLSVSLAFLNSCLNPILYVFMCEEFLKKLRQSICLVLESALAEDGLSFASSRSLSSWIPRKSSSTAPAEGKDTSSTLTEGKVFHTEVNGAEDANNVMLENEKM